MCARMFKSLVALAVLSLVIGCSSSTSTGSNEDCSSLPGDACTTPDAQCFTTSVTGGAWLRCCNGAWFEEQGAGADAAQFTCP